MSLPWLQPSSSQGWGKYIDKVLGNKYIEKDHLSTSTGFFQMYLGTYRGYNYQVPSTLAKLSKCNY